jgi:type I restriction enzyme, S subunit
VSDSPPPEWGHVHLRDVAEVQTGVAKGRRRLSSPVTRPYLRVANVQDGYLSLEDVKQIVVDESEVTRYELHAGDVLLTEGGDSDKLGRGTVWRGEIPGCLHQNHVFAVRPDRNVVEPDFLASLIASRQGRRYFDAASKQTTNLASINASQVRGFSIPLPGLDEQRHITRVLLGWVEHLHFLDRLLEAKRRFKRGLMQQLLTGKRRFKEYARERWSEVHLGDVFEERAETGRSDLPLLSITVDRGVIPRDEVERRDTSNADKSKYLRIAPGDIGYNTMRMWQGVSALSTLEGIVSPAYTICIPSEHVDGAFAAQLFKLPDVVDLFRRYSQGLVDDTLSLKFHHFAQIRVRLPAVGEQRAIAAVLQAMDRELQLLDQLREVLDRQRRGVMELLLTGKIRVPA